MLNLHRNVQVNLNVLYTMEKRRNYYVYYVYNTFVSVIDCKLQTVDYVISNYNVTLYPPVCTGILYILRIKNNTKQ